VIKVTIFLVTNNYKPYSGGVVSSIDVLQEELTNLGHKAFIVTLDFVGKKDADPAHVLRIPCIARFAYKQNPMAVAWRPKEYLEKLICQFRPDIIHVHHPLYLGMIAAKLAKKCNIPCVFTYHTRYDEYAHYIPVIPKCITQTCVRRRIEKFCKYVDTIIVPSATIAQVLKKNCIQTSIIPSAISESFFSFDVRKLTIPIRLLTVSRFVPEKNIPFLLRIMKLLDKHMFQLTLIGYGTLLHKLKRYAYNELYLSPEQISFVVKPSKEELLFYYKKAHLFIFASQTETQGLVLGESLATGLPIIALNAPGSTDSITHGENGFLINSECDMKEMIENVVRDQHMYDTLQHNAFKSAQKYRAQYMGKAIEELYKNLMRLSF
jgi:glycosyltransferase involved in cell wall biosynthesis